MNVLELGMLLISGLPGTAELPAEFDLQGHRSQIITVQPATAPSRRGGDSADWQALGPAGGRVNDVARSSIVANVALAGTASGLYRSVDGGANWAQVAAIGELGVDDVEFAPDGTAYAGTFNSVWKSTDDGVSWSQQNLGIGVNDQVLDIAIDPNNASNLWAGVSDAIGAQSNNVMRSTNGGATWFSATPPLAAAISCTGIALNPNDSGEVFAVFAGLNDGEVWFSSDGGTTWLNRSAGLPGNPLNDVVHDGSRALVAGGQLFGSQFVGLYTSTNDGVTWTPLHDGTWPLLVVNDVDLDPDDPMTLLAATAGSGVHRSSDGGSSWQLAIGGTSTLAVQSVHFAAAGSDVIFLGTASQGVFRSTDGGAGFGSSSTGINLLDVNSVAANPNNTNELAAAFAGQNDGGVFSSTDGGASWSMESVPPTRYKTVRFAPDGTLYAISDGPSTIAQEGLYRREANGTWAALGPDQGSSFESQLDALHFSVNDPDLILVAGSDFGVAGSEPTIWRSLDAGQNWTKVYEGIGLTADVSDLEIVADGTDSEMLASYFFGNPGGVLRSLDGGTSWFDSGAGLPADVEGSSLCASPSDTGHFYLADQAFAPDSGGLHRTTDGGTSWQNSGYFGHPLAEVVCDPVQDNVVYIAQLLFADEAVLRSEDQGATFAAFDTGLGDVGARRSLSLAAGPEPRLFLASSLGSFTTLLAEPIFADGFESGDTTAWAASAP